MPIESETRPWLPCSNGECWRRLIVLGGLSAGLSFIVFQIALSWLFSGRPFFPLRLFAAPLLGMEVLARGYPRENVIPIGLISLGALSVFSAYILAALLSQFPKLAATSASLITSACVLGYVLWILDFLLIDRAMSARDIFWDFQPGLHGFVGHVFFFGFVLGLYMDRKQEKRETVTHVRFRF
jgi:hypothetical protein